MLGRHRLEPGCTEAAGPASVLPPCSGAGSAGHSSLGCWGSSPRTSFVSRLKRDDCEPAVAPAASRLPPSSV